MREACNQQHFRGQNFCHNPQWLAAILELRLIPDRVALQLGAERPDSSPERECQELSCHDNIPSQGKMSLGTGVNYSQLAPLPLRRVVLKRQIR